MIDLSHTNQRICENRFVRRKRKVKRVGDLSIFRNVITNRADYRTKVYNCKR